MNKKELTKYWRLFCEVWHLFRKYSNVTGTDEYWERFRNDAERLFAWCPAGMCQELIRAVQEELERIERRRERHEL